MAPARQQSQETSIEGDGATATITISNFAVGAGSNRSLVAKVSWREGSGTAPQVNSVVFDPGGTPEAFTLRAQAQNNWGGDNFITSEIWILDNPTNQTEDITATLNEAPDATIGVLGFYVEEYDDANNGVGGNTGTATGNDNNPTTTFNTGDSDSLIVAGAGIDSTASPDVTPGSGTTEIDENSRLHTIDFLWWSAEEAASGGSDEIDGTVSSGNRWAIAAVELQAAAVGGVSPTGHIEGPLYGPLGGPI